MSYGVEVMTQNGMENLADLISARLVYSVVRNSNSSGSYAAGPDWNPAQGFFYAQELEGTYLPDLNISGSTVSWNQRSGTVFTLFFFHTSETNTGAGYGFWAKNGDDAVVLDDRYTTLRVKSRGTSTGSSRGSTYRHRVPCDPDDLIFVSLAVGDHASATLGYSDDTYRDFQHTSASVSYVVASAEAITTPASSGVGLQLFNAAGECIFDSSNEMFVITGGTTRKTGTVNDIPVSAFDQYFSMSSGGIRLSESPGGPIGSIYTFHADGMRRTSTTNIQYQSIVVSETLGPPGAGGGGSLHSFSIMSAK